VSLSAGVIVPIVSAAALERMARLTADSPCDNVVLEWSFALELSKQRNTKVYPLFIGEVAEDGSVGALFSSGALERVADVCVDSVQEVLLKQMGELRIPPSAEARTRTAKQVVGAITRMLGLPVDQHAVAHSGTGVEGLWRRWGLHEAIAEQVRKVHAEAATVGATAACEVEGLAALLASADCAEELPAATRWCVENGVRSVDYLVRGGAELCADLVASLTLKRAPKSVLEQELGRRRQRVHAAATTPAGIKGPASKKVSLPAELDGTAAAPIGPAEVSLLRQKTSRSLAQLLGISLTPSGKTVSSGKRPSQKVRETDDSTLSRWYEHARRLGRAAGSRKNVAAPADDPVAGLRVLLFARDVNLGGKYEAALAWCEEQGCDSIAMLKELGMEDELVAALQLKPAKAKQLRKRIAEFAPPELSERLSVGMTQMSGSM
jgi:hypothetical protein